MNDFIGLVKTLRGLHDLHNHVRDYSLAQWGKCYEERLSTIMAAIHILETQHGLRTAVEKSTGARFLVVGHLEAGTIVLTQDGEKMTLCLPSVFADNFEFSVNPVNDRIAALMETNKGMVACLMTIAGKLDIVNKPKPEHYTDETIANTTAWIIGKVEALIEERHRFSAMAGEATENVRTLREQVGKPIVTFSFIPCRACADGMACATAQGCRLKGEINADELKQ